MTEKGLQSLSKLAEDLSNLGEFFHDAEIIKIDVSNYIKDKKVNLIIRTQNKDWSFHFFNVKKLIVDEFLFQNVTNEAMLFLLPEKFDMNVKGYLESVQFLSDVKDYPSMINSERDKLLYLEPSVGAFFYIVFEKMDWRTINS